MKIFAKRLNLIFALTLLSVSTAFSAPVVAPGKASRPYPGKMPPIAMMQMQQQEGLQSRLDKKQQFIIATEAEISRLDAEMQKATSQSNPKLMKALRSSKKMHQQSLAQARIDLSVLEKEKMRFTQKAAPSVGHRFFSKVPSVNTDKVKN